MKRSKLFLGATTFVLAIAAIAATKAKQTAAIHGYYSVNGGNCIVTGPKVCTTGGPLNCTTGTQALFTRVATGKCANQLTKAISD
jgi:hypothetical protein